MLDHFLQFAPKLAGLLRQLSKGSVDIIFWRFVQLFVSITDKRRLSSLPRQNMHIYCQRAEGAS
jgi:hypothetical protein